MELSSNDGFAMMVMALTEAAKCLTFVSLYRQMSRITLFENHEIERSELRLISSGAARFERSENRASSSERSEDERSENSKVFLLK